MPLVKRLVKGSALTYAEADGNLTYLDNKVTGSAGLIPVFDSANTVTGSSVLELTGSLVTVNGSLTVTGDLTAMQYIISSSVTHFTESFSSGSTRFGDSLDDTHQFTGSVLITGSSQVIGTQSITGSLTISGSTFHNGFLSSSDGAYFSNQITVTHMTIGHGPTENNTNLAIGWLTMPVLGSGLRNTVVGASSAQQLQSGSDNTVFGNGALASLVSGSSNTAIGNNAGFYASGSGNVFIGHQAGQLQTSGDNKLWIANSNTLNPLIKGDFGTGELRFYTPSGFYVTGGLSIRDTGNKSEFQVNTDIKQLILSDNIDPFNQFQVALSGSSFLNSSPQVKLTSGEKGFNIDDTVKILSTGTQITGSLIITGSSVFSGSASGVVNVLSISSNTASLDLNRGNFFTLQLVGGTNTYINPSNIKPGQTVNVLISTTGSGTVSFPNTVLQASGSAYVPTTTTGKDIITLVSYDSTNLYLANVKNFI